LLGGDADGRVVVDAQSVVMLTTDAPTIHAGALGAGGEADQRGRGWRRGSVGTEIESRVR
jgi:hypothetical protein